MEIDPNRRTGRTTKVFIQIINHYLDNPSAKVVFISPCYPMVRCCEDAFNKFINEKFPEVKGKLNIQFHGFDGLDINKLRGIKNIQLFFDHMMWENSYDHDKMDKLLIIETLSWL